MSPVITCSSLLSLLPLLDTALDTSLALAGGAVSHHIWSFDHDSNMFMLLDTLPELYSKTQIEASSVWWNGQWTIDNAADAIKEWDTALKSALASSYTQQRSWVVFALGKAGALTLDEYDKLTLKEQDSFIYLLALEDGKIVN